MMTLHPIPESLNMDSACLVLGFPNTLPQGHDDIDVPTSELLLQSDPKPPNPKPRTGRTLTVVRVVGSKGRA